MSVEFDQALRERLVQKGFRTIIFKLDDKVIHLIPTKTPPTNEDPEFEGHVQYDINDTLVEVLATQPLPDGQVLIDTDFLKE